MPCQPWPGRAIWAAAVIRPTGAVNPRVALARTRLFKALAAGLVLACAASGAKADATANARYVVNWGGNIIATANFTFTDSGGKYDLDLSANVTGIAQLVASGTAKASSS